MKAALADWQERTEDIPAENLTPVMLELGHVRGDVLGSRDPRRHGGDPRRILGQRQDAAAKCR